MPRASHACLALVAFASGSWLGLGAPSARELPHYTWERAQEAAPAPPPARVADEEPPPRAFDPSWLPSSRPWPRLNVDASTTRAWLLAEGPSRATSPACRPITLTFDDGPFPETTPLVLKVLAKRNLHATFFFIGRYLDGDDERAVDSRKVARDVAAAGHLVGNHTHDHLLLTQLPPAEVQAQIDEGAASIERATGIRPVVFRPPYGKLDDWGRKLVRERGLELILWSIEVADMQHDDAVAMSDSLKTQLQYAQGGLVLLHDIRFSTIAALDKLLAWLDRHPCDPNRPDAEGYEVVDLAEYLRRTANAPQPYADRATLERARGDAHVRERRRRLQLSLGDGEI